MAVASTSGTTARYNRLALGEFRYIHEFMMEERFPKGALVDFSFEETYQPVQTPNPTPVLSFCASDVGGVPKAAVLSMELPDVVEEVWASFAEDPGPMPLPEGGRVDIEGPNPRWDIEVDPRMVYRLSATLTL
jgi:hypothetical protein